MGSLTGRDATHDRVVCFIWQGQGVLSLKNTKQLIVFSDGSGLGDLTIRVQRSGVHCLNWGFTPARIFMNGNGPKLLFISFSQLFLSKSSNQDSRSPPSLVLP